VSDAQLPVRDYHAHSRPIGFCYADPDCNPYGDGYGYRDQDCHGHGYRYGDCDRDAHGDGHANGDCNSDRDGLSDVGSDNLHWEFKQRSVRVHPVAYLQQARRRS
jgi:hypothetical protein